MCDCAHTFLVVAPSVCAHLWLYTLCDTQCVFVSVHFCVLCVTVCIFTCTIFVSPFSRTVCLFAVYHTLASLVCVDG